MSVVKTCSYNTNVIQLAGCDDIHVDTAAYDTNNGIITLFKTDGSSLTIDISTCCNANADPPLTVDALTFDNGTRILTLTTSDGTLTTTIPETETTLVQNDNSVVYTNESSTVSEVILGYSNTVAPASTIDVTHNLNRTGITWSLMDAATNTTIVPDTVINLTNNMLRFTFTPVPANNIEIRVS
jgi:hypothetical protein